MRPIADHSRRAVAPFLLFVLAASAFAQDEPRPESAYLKLLKKAPEGRMSTIIDVIGKRGTADDLAYLYERATADGGLAEVPRLKALEALDEAATTRQLRPKVEPAGLIKLVAPANSKVTPAVRLAAVRLSGTWKESGTVADLLALAGAKSIDPRTRSAAFEALASIGGPEARKAIDALASPDRPTPVRALAVAALARLDPALAAGQAAGVLAGEARIEDVTPMIGAFLDRKGGSDQLAAAVEARKPSADGARLALRAVYLLGRADEALVSVLGKSAGLEADLGPPTPAQMETLVREVAARGDAARGEAVFRRAEINCMKCHALNGAAGGVGPELSSLGLSSPVDYVVNSVLIPDQAIKEEYQTRLVQTDDGLTLQGIAVEEDDKRLVLKDATGAIRVVPIASIEATQKGGSLMPKGLANLLTHAEFVDLVRFLSELGKPGPYALRPTPTIQRWRVLKDPTAEVAEAIQADPAAWTPAYAEVAGTLPLAEIAGQAGEKAAVIQGEINVSAAGPVVFRFNSAKGVTAWLDDQPLPQGDAPTVEVTDGVRKLTLRVELKDREGMPIRVEVAKAEGSSVEFSVVGGR